MVLPSTSILVTSYNQASSLRLLFASLDRQTNKDFEVIIADDGSSDGTQELCHEKRTFPLIFVTQEDVGYRKSKILNQALRKAASDYLIFIDGDVILERHFVQDHLHLRKTGHFVCGRRVELGPKLSPSITVSDVSRGDFDHLQMKVILSALKKDTISIKRGLRITYPLLRKALGYDRPLDLLGSNFSVWKTDLISVNGFNESLESYWGEDGDLFIRLRNAGKRPVGAKSLCIQYHVFHTRREPTPENTKRYQLLLQDTQYKWAEKGYSTSAEFSR
jgi:glycosyltransferase involved in cell wall biosynthesis